MRIPSRAAARLAELSETFGDPDIDIARSLTQFAEQVKSAVPSFLGVSVQMTAPDWHHSIDAMEDSYTPGGIGSSVRIPTSGALAEKSDQAGDGPRIAFVLYAAVPGALVDLAADLAWLTALGLADFAQDEHLAGPGPSGSTAEAASVLDQAIGMLLARGQVPEHARMQIDRRAARSGLSRYAVAAAILVELSLPDPPSDR